MNQRIETKIHNLKPLNHLRLFHMALPSDGRGVTGGNTDLDFKLNTLLSYHILTGIRHEEQDTKVENIQSTSGDITDNVMLKTENDLRAQVHERSNNHIFLQGISIDYM